MNNAALPTDQIDQPDTFEAALLEMLEGGLRLLAAVSKLNDDRSCRRYLVGNSSRKTDPCKALAVAHKRPL